MFIKRIHIFNIIYCGLFVASSSAMLQAIVKSGTYSKKSNVCLIQHKPITRYCTTNKDSSRQEGFAFYNNGKPIISTEYLKSVLSFKEVKLCNIDCECIKRRALQYSVVPAIDLKDDDISDVVKYIKQCKNIVASAQDLIENKDRLLVKNLWPVKVVELLENKLETNKCILSARCHRKKIIGNNIAVGLEQISIPITALSGIIAFLSVIIGDASCLDTMPSLITCASGFSVWTLARKYQNTNSDIIFAAALAKKEIKEWEAIIAQFQKEQNELRLKKYKI